MPLKKYIPWPKIVNNTFQSFHLRRKDKQKVKFENLIDGIPSEIDSDLESSPSKKDIP